MEVYAMAKFPMKTKSSVLLIILVFLLYFISVSTSQIFRIVGSAIVSLLVYSLSLSEEKPKKNILFIIFCIAIGVITYIKN